MAIHHQQRQPVVGRAFGKGHRQDNDADQQQLRVAPHRQTFRLTVGDFGGIFTGAVGNGADSNGDGQDSHQRSRQDVRGGRQTESGHCHAHPGAEQGAKAVEAMHHRQHRFIHLPLDGRAFDVNSDLCGAEAGAEDSQTEGEQRGGSDPQRQAEHQHAKHGEGHGGADDLAGTKALHQPRRAENTAHRPHRQTKQHHAHLCGG